MGKRSAGFERRERDFYQTPLEAVKPLVPNLPCRVCYMEPCAGDGQLINNIKKLIPASYCSLASDIEPRGDGIQKFPYDSYCVDIEPNWPFDYFITNPPWDRKILHPLIDHLRMIAPTWLLFDADWMHTKQSAEYMRYCQKVVSVGRVKWIPDSKMTGKDNVAWYLFSKEPCQTTFYGRDFS